MAINTLDLKTPVPCIQGKFTEGIVTYVTQVPPNQLINLLGHDPRSKNWKKLPDELKNIYEYLQRKTSKSRRESVSGYIEERFGPDPIAIGAFPAVSVALKDPAIFEPYGDGRQKAVGDLMIDLAPDKFRVVIDGLARLTGAMDLIEEGKADLVEHFLFPVTIYAPAPDSRPFTWQQMGQLFHDFNFRVQPVSRQHAIALDTSDLYISLANELSQEPVFTENGGVAVRAASLGSKSTELIVQTVLVRTVRGACEGRKFQESNLATTENANLTAENRFQVLAALDDYFSGIAGRMGDRFKARDSLHMTSPGWQALGIVFNDIHFKLNLSDFERSRVMDEIAAIDWSRYNPDWLKLGIGHAEKDKKTGEVVTDDQGRVRVALTGSGRTNTQHLIDYIRQRTSLADKLKLAGGDTDEAA